MTVHYCGGGGPGGCGGGTCGGANDGFGASAGGFMGDVVGSPAAGSPAPAAVPEPEPAPAEGEAAGPAPAPAPPPGEMFICWYLLSSSCIRCSCAQHVNEPYRNGG